ncbi:unnamed protein product [Nezara viridula]|uniref:BHLH domain-containing protein n=1 Tax=Nezara viridula TaxID=85310 RepID=A0A9P0H9P3_NEZVI|nr:unnamed protein product [Nezara viridula]
MLSGFPNLMSINMPRLSIVPDIPLPMMPIEPLPPQGNQAANFEWDRDLQEWDWSTVSAGLDLEVPPEEFWKKFEELPDLGDNFETLFAEVNGLGNTSPPSGSAMSDVLRNHDCMWAGVCHSKEHKSEEPQKATSSQRAQQSPQSKEKKKTVIVQMSRSLLINNRPLTDNMLLRPDTPQSSESEDEPVAKKTVSPTEVTGQYRRIQSLCPSPEVTSVHFDHNYGNKKLRTDELGVQTPSDSEEEVEEVEEEDEEEEEREIGEEEEEEECDNEDEEVDVEEIDPESLSLLLKNNNNNNNNTQVSPPLRTTVRTIRTPARTLLGQRNAHTLPNNPSKQMQDQIQDEMASAITTSSLISASKAVSRRLNGAIKRKRTTTPAAPARGRRRAAAPKRSRFSNGYLIDTEKRSLHNNMERLRRVDLRNAFEDLRQLVPATADSHKAAKVTILKDATHYVRELHLKDRNCSAQLAALRREQDRLRTTLSQLRRIFAYKNSQQIL